MKLCIEREQETNILELFVQGHTPFVHEVHKPPRAALPAPPPAAPPPAAPPPAAETERHPSYLDSISPVCSMNKAPSALTCSTVHKHGSNTRNSQHLGFSISSQEGDFSSGNLNLSSVLTPELPPALSTKPTLNPQPKVHCL